jgi:hypothetical protein
VWRQLIEATPWGTKPRHLLRDRDAVYGREFRKRARRIGIDAIASPIHAPTRTMSRQLPAMFIVALPIDVANHLSTWK